MFKTIEVDIDPRGVARLTFNRPEKHNAMSATMIAEITASAQQLGANDEVRVVVLAARGKSFCAGADLAWMQAQIDADGATRAVEARKLARMLQTLNELPKPLIGEVQGNAFGGGIGLISVCDVAFVAADARFALTETRLGLIPATIGPYVLARIGATHARRYFTSAQMMSAATARSIGLASEVVEPADLSSAVDMEVSHFLTCAPGAVAAAKSLVVSQANTISDQVIDDSIAALISRWETDETAEGIAAFFDNRKPSWVRQEG